MVHKSSCHQLRLVVHPIVYIPGGDRWISASKVAGSFSPPSPPPKKKKTLSQLVSRPYPSSHNHGSTDIYRKETIVLEEW